VHETCYEKHTSIYGAGSFKDEKTAADTTKKILDEFFSGGPNAALLVYPK